MALKRGELSEAETGEGCQQDEHSEARRHGVGELEDLGDVEERPLGGRGCPGALDTAPWDVVKDIPELFAED
ncbi:hypothetical protein [Streptomyces sp. NPDC013489]|uniref:hypothetical protein n=1 Tax=Streptomyces sp. NPDC013489 TaxID=3155606 RepID=UPI0033FDF6F4